MDKLSTAISDKDVTRVPIRTPGKRKKVVIQATPHTAQEKGKAVVRDLPPLPADDVEMEITGGQRAPMPPSEIPLQNPIPLQSPVVMQQAPAPVPAPAPAPPPQIMVTPPTPPHTQAPPPQQMQQPPPPPQEQTPSKLRPAQVFYQIVKERNLPPDAVPIDWDMALKVYVRSAELAQEAGLLSLAEAGAVADSIMCLINGAQEYCGITKDGAVHNLLQVAALVQRKGGIFMLEDAAILVKLGGHLKAIPSVR